MCPANPKNFNVDNVRVSKLIGGSVNKSSVVNGLILRRDTEGTIKTISDAKVGVTLTSHA